MTFLSLAIEKSSLTTQKSQLEFQEMMLSEELNQTEEAMQELVNSNEDDDVDVEDTAEYKLLEMMDEQYNSQKDSLESQLSTINAEIESYGKAVDTNIKSECKLSISV